MTKDDILQALTTIEEKIFSLPLEHPDERQKTFDQTYEQLSELLQHVNVLSKEEKHHIMPIVQDFSDRIRKALRSIEEKIKNFEQGIQSTRSHVDGVKAYAVQKTFK